MFIRIRTLSILVLLPFTHAQTSGTGTTTRYFDCCKPSCGYPGKLTPASFSNVVRSCSINDTPLADFNAQSACAGGSAYTCSDQTPWAVSETLAYGFAAVNIAGGNEKSWCCACYELTFASGGVAGKRMIVQATNTGGDLGVNHFDLAIPGGGFGIFDACTTEWKDTSTDWGARYGGISTRAQCDTFPEQLKPGCYWRFDWFLNADNPPVSFKQVSCPAALTERSGCVRADDEQIPTVSSAVSSYGGVSSTEILSQGTSTSTGSQSTGASISTSTKTSSLSTSVPASETGTGTGSSGLVAAYGQCGGRDWNGGTQCIGGYTCVPQAGNPYYSQCLPTPSTLSSLSRSTASALTSSSSSSPGTSQSTTILTKTSQSSTLSDYGPTPSPGSGTTAPSYGQCGGIGWTGPTACGLGYTCQVTNPYYSQCVPNPTDPGAVPAYGQCGGLNYNGARMCTVGYTCKIVNPYYSQCLPS